jgi:dTDP-4-dehydrorhamnose 3,5-epimerase-like enzyme
MLQSLVISETNRQAILIPPRVQHGFKNIGEEEVWCLNAPNRVYNADGPDEFRRDPFDSEIGFKWEVPEHEC